jgi:hypothetical protein
LNHTGLSLVGGINNFRNLSALHREDSDEQGGQECGPHRSACGAVAWQESLQQNKIRPASLPERII